MSVIHPTAIIEEGAVLGTDVEIGPYCCIGPNVVLGDGVVIKSHVVIDGRTTLGNGVKVFPFASLGQEPQDLKYGGEPARLEVGANTIIREYVTMHIGTEGGGMLTKVGDNCLIMGAAHVAHDWALGGHLVDKKCPPSLANRLPCKPFRFGKGLPCKPFGCPPLCTDPA
jgi:UDP-N-acetylglucosamine acyltransferase